MARRPEIDSTRQTQAALEAIEVLKNVGFLIESQNIETEPRDSTFTLEIDLLIPEDERPLRD